jgi:crotonobetainyl-CoA:carnitine CoA-transferase CaiB-like acyl-CoA transferase
MGPPSAGQGSLAGVRVLDCSESLPAASCTAMLERLGAEVVRVQVKGAADGFAPAFLDAYLSDSESYRTYLRRGAGRQQVDLSAAAGVTALRDLAQTADVVVEDRREPLPDLAGLDVRTLAGPRGVPILVSVTPHGRGGPRRDDLACDLTIFHGAGPGHAVPGLVRDPRTMAPLRLGSHQGSFVSGLVAAINVCAALLARDRARGARVSADVSCHEALANSYRQSLGTFAYYGGGTNRDLARGRGAGGMADHRNLACKDGYVTIIWGGVQQWDSLKGMLGDPPWMDDQDFTTPALRYRNWARIVPHLEEWAAEFEKEHLLYLCQGWRIPCAPVNGGAELIASEVLAARDFWQPAAISGRTVPMPGLPGRGHAARPAGGRASSRSQPEMRRVLPLDGVRVVDFTHFVAGPHATLWLASLGADVMKIESPKRPDAFRLSQLKANIEPTLNNSAIFATTNLMKRSCCIDIATPAGQELCHGLVAASDVVVANFRPGILEQFGLDYETLSAINPALIMAVITGYGYTGEFAAFQALGPNIHAFSGLSAATGYPGGPPEQLFGTYADVIAGQVAALSILAALYQRETTGCGDYLDIAMSEAMISVAPQAVLDAALLHAETPRQGNDEPGTAPHGCYPCAGDDRWIAIATFGDNHWHRLLTVLGLGRLRDDPRFTSAGLRWTNRRALDELIGAATAAHAAADLAAALQQAGVAATVVRTAEDVLADPQLLADDFLGPVTHAELGEAVLPKMPWRITVDGAGERPIGPAPDFGHETRQILQALVGVTDEQWADLREGGVVA